MATDEIQEVLANWIEQASSSEGRIADGVKASEWVAARFSEWWRERADETVAAAEFFTSDLRDELTRLGGWDLSGEAMEALVHLEDALGDLRAIMHLGTSDE